MGSVLVLPTLTVNVSWTEQCFIILEFCLSLSFSLLSISPSVDQIHVNTSGGRWKLRTNYFKDNDTLSSPFVRFCLFVCLFKNILMIKAWMNDQLHCGHICAAVFLVFSGQLRTTSAEDFHKRRGEGKRGREGNRGGECERERAQCQQKIMHWTKLSGNWV